MNVSERFRLSHTEADGGTTVTDVARDADTGYWHLGALGQDGQVDNELDEILDDLSRALPLAVRILREQQGRAAPAEA